MALAVAFLLSPPLSFVDAAFSTAPQTILLKGTNKEVRLTRILFGVLLAFPAQLQFCSPRRRRPMALTD
jgi:TRAP-type mannitol/chloroaromatic compound transport system permease large subunit